MRRPPRSSGDLIADRRYAYAEDLAKQGDLAAAADLMAQAVERAPGWAAAWRALGRYRRDLLDRAGAEAAFRECLRLDPSDPFGASLELALLGAAEPVASAPPAYVEALFDAYAPDFDRALVERLHYGAPQALAKLVRLIRSPHRHGRRFARALDLGCGTGLAGEALRADIAWLEGVDLSQGMIDAAYAKGVYDRLEKSDIAAALAAPGPAADLIIAADVFTYLGDLTPIVPAIARRLAPDGLAAFSVERGHGADWTVRDSLRFAHSPDYLRRLARESGLALAAFEETVLRKDRGADVAGLLVVLHRAPERPAEAGFDSPGTGADTAPSAG